MSRTARTSICLPAAFVVVLLGAVVITIGNQLPRTRPNVAVGVRTQRTLANAGLWQQVHRVSGYATVGLGVVIAITGLLMTGAGMTRVAGIAAFAAGTAVLISYVRYARA